MDAIASLNYDSDCIMLQNYFCYSRITIIIFINFIALQEAWLTKPTLLEADKDCKYAAEIHIDLNKITEPILCAPNDPDDARLLSEVAGRKIDEVFVGSCMTNIGHFRGEYLTAAAAAAAAKMLLTD